MNESYGLEQIVLHQSFKKVHGRTVSIPCGDRTHLGGENGEGKTSILALIPVFYGQIPERLVEKGSGKQSFLDYYLPVPASQIIFEYRQVGGYCCAVLFRYQNERGRQIRYQFVQGRVDETFRHPEIQALMERGADARTVLHEIKALGFEVSGLVDTTKAYRAILQGDRELLRSLPDAKKVRAMAVQYGLRGQEDRPMSHIEKLTTVVLNKSQLVSSFKQMICETQFRDLHQSAAPRAADGQGLSADIKSLREFEKHERQIQDCLAQEDDRRRIEQRIRKTAADLKTTLALEQVKQGELKLKVQQAEDTIREARDRFEDEEEQAGRGLRETESQRNEAAKNLQFLRAENTQYETDGLPALLDDYARLPQLRAELEQAKRLLQVLTDQVAALTSNKEDALREEREHYLGQKEDLDKARKAARETQLEQQGSDAQARGDLKLQLAQERSQWHQQRQAGLTQLEKRVDVLQERLRGVGRTPEEDARIEKASQSLQGARGAKDQADAQERVLEEAREGAKEAFKHAQEALERCDRTLGQKRDQRDGLAALLNPEDGSWLAALREQDPEWVKDLAKVVHPDLLSRKNLAPQYQALAPRTLMGWSLALTDLPSPDIALSEEDLRRRLEAADSEVNAAKTALEKAESRCKDRRDALKTANERLQRAQGDTREATGALERADQYWKQEKKIVGEAVRTRRSQCELELKQVEADVKAHHDATESLEKALEAQLAQQLKTFDHGAADRDQALEKEVQGLDTRLQEVETTFDHQKTALEKAYAQKLRAAGIDPQAVADARADQERLETRIGTLETQQDDIRAYRKWLQRDWPQAPTLDDEVVRLNREIGRQEDEQKERKKAHTSLLERLRKERDHLEAQAKALGQRIERADTLLTGITFRVADNGDFGDLDRLVAELGEDLKNEQGLSQKIQKTVQTLQEVILRAEGTQVNQAWKRLQQERAAMRPDEANTASVDDLRQLLETDLPQLRDALMASFRTEAGRLNGYYEGLQVLATQIGAVSRKLSRELNLTQRIASLDNIRVVLKSRIEEEDAWGPLKDFAQAWQQWQDAHREALPDDRVITLFEQVEYVFRQGRTDPSVESMTDLRIEMEENGRPVIIRTDKDFTSASSTGLSYLAIMVVFMGMTRYLCPDGSVRVTWPIDELATISENNVAHLSEMLTQHNLTIFSAAPRLGHELRHFFDSRRRIHKGRIQQVMTHERAQDAVSLRERLVADGLAQGGLHEQPLV